MNLTRCEDSKKGMEGQFSDNDSTMNQSPSQAPTIIIKKGRTKKVVDEKNPTLTEELKSIRKRLMYEQTEDVSFSGDEADFADAASETQAPKQKPQTVVKEPETARRGTKRSRPTSIIVKIPVDDTKKR